MQRFILSAFSVLLITAAVAPTAQALPEISSDFDLQTLRLNEFDARDRVAPTPQAPTPQAPTPQAAADAEYPEYSDQTANPTQWEAPEAQAEEAATTLSDRRHEALDRDL